MTEIPLVDPLAVVPVRGAAVSAESYRAAVDAFTGEDGLPRAIDQMNDSFLAANANFAGIAASLATAEASAAAAQDTFEALVADSLPEVVGSSSSTVLIGLGTKSFTASTGKLWWAGLNLAIRDAANPANYVIGPVTAYDPGTGALTIDAKNIGGSGSPTSWLIAPGGPRDLTATRATYEAIGSPVSTASGSAWTWTNIPAVYSDLRFEIRAVAYTSTASLQVQHSTDNGSTWSTALPIAASEVAAISGEVRLHHYRATAPTFVSALYPGGLGVAAAAGPVNAVRLSFSSGATGTDGSIQLYGI